MATNILSLIEDQHAFINKSINVTGPKSLSYSQAAEILSKEIGRTITYLDVSEDDARNGMKHSGMSDWLIDVIMNRLNYIIRGDMDLKLRGN